MKRKLIVIFSLMLLLLAGTVAVVLAHTRGNGNGNDSAPPYIAHMPPMAVVSPGAIIIEDSPYIDIADAHLWRTEAYVQVEIGSGKSALDPLLFIANRHVGGGPRSIAFACGLAQVDLYVLGPQPVMLLVEGAPLTSYIYVIDTTAPVATPVEVIMPVGSDFSAQDLNAADFVADVFDHSQPVDIRFERTPSRDEAQEVVVRVTDAEGNYTLVTVPLRLVFNDEPPRIYGAQTIEATVGNAILFLRGITAYDAFDRPLRPYVYSHNVNPDALGRYYVTYAVQCGWGLRTYVTVDVHIIRVAPATVLTMVDDLLTRILTEDMTQVQQARAIFNWVTRNVTYAGYINRRSLYEGAYQGLRHRRGDCFTFYALSELMLTQAGIPNMRISRVGGASDHYWNLINPDNLGWHHFDTSPHNLYIRGLNRFMFTNSEARSHTAYIYRVLGRRNFYTFDASLYPEIVA